MDTETKVFIVEDLVLRGRDISDACLAVALRHPECLLKSDIEAELLEEKYWERNSWNPGPDAATRTGMYD